MRALEGRRPDLVAAPRRPSLAGIGGPWPLHADLRRRGVGTGPGKPPRARCAPAGRAVGLVPEGDRTCRRGLAGSAAPPWRQEVRLRADRRASLSPRALRFICDRARLLRPGRSDWSAAHARGRRDNPGPHGPCRGGQAARGLSGCGNPCLCAPSDSRSGRGAPPGARALRGRGALGLWRCAKKSLEPEWPSTSGRSIAV
jgi:hypothetical protein